MRPSRRSAFTPIGWVDSSHRALSGTDRPVLAVLVCTTATLGGRRCPRWRGCHRDRVTCSRWNTGSVDRTPELLADAADGDRRCAHGGPGHGFSASTCGAAVTAGIARVGGDSRSVDLWLARRLARREPLTCLGSVAVVGRVVAVGVACWGRWRWTGRIANWCGRGRLSTDAAGTADRVGLGRTGCSGRSFTPEHLVVCGCLGRPSRCSSLTFLDEVGGYDPALPCCVMSRLRLAVNRAARGVGVPAAGCGGTARA